MSDVDVDVLLLSSNSRRQYTEDILSVVACPRGSVQRFRYQSSYVAPTLQQAISTRKIIGKHVIVGYNDETGTALSVPIRRAKILDVIAAADIYVFKLKIEEYADLTQYPNDAGELRKQSEEFIKRLKSMNGNSFYPATMKFPELTSVRFNHGNDGEAWSSIINRLTRSATFSDAYFARIEQPSLAQDNRRLELGTDGSLRLTEERAIKLTCHFFSDQYGGSEKKIECVTDNNFLRPSSTAKYFVLSRYDTVEFWLQPSLVNFRTLSHADVQLASDDPSFLTTRVSFPVIVERSAPQVAARAVLGAVGAFLLAVPAILGPTSDVYLRLLLGVLGALLVSYVTVYMGAGRK